VDSAVTTQLAAYAATAQYSDFPDAVRREALRSVFNILGCMLGGARHRVWTSPTRRWAALLGNLGPH
jgi:2-methylcitrate dehydratase PrpD